MAESPASNPALRRLRALPAFFAIRFRPVPVKARHDGWTPERQRGFIDRLVITGCVARSAKSVGKTPQSAYRLRERSGAASFRKAWDRALEAGQAHMLDVATERSLIGEVFPVVRNGRCVGEMHRFDNRLAIALLNAMDRREESRPPADPVETLERYLASLDLAADGSVEK